MGNLIITNTYMRSDDTPHWAESVDTADPYGPWAVSWLPDRHLTRNQATTAMMLAKAVAAMQKESRTVVDDSHRLWPRIDNWAAELDLTGPAAVARISEADPGLA